MSVLTSLRAHWPIKLGALVLGITLWLYVKTDQRYEHVVSLPLHVTEPSGHFVVASELPATVKVRIVASGKDLLFRTLHGRVVVRVRVAQREAVTVDLGPEQIEGIDQSSGFEVVGIESPQSILLDFDYFDRREVPVVPRIGIIPRAGYTLVGRAGAEPRTVHIRGPRRYVRDVESVETDSLVLTDVAGDVDRAVRLRLPPEPNLTADSEQVTVHAAVQVLLERRFPDIPVHVTHVSRGVRVRAIPERVTVDVIGGDKVVSGMSLENVNVELDYRQRFEKGLDNLVLTASLPPFVRLVRMNPPTASIVVGKAEGRR